MSLSSAALKQTVALEYQDRYSCEAHLTFRGRGRTWQALTVAVGASQPAAPTVQFRGRCATSTGNWVSMSRGTSGPTSIWWEIRRCTQDSTPRPTSRRQESQTPFKKTPRADMERSGQRAPDAARVARFAAQTPPQWEGQRVPIAGPESARWREGQSVL